MHIFVGAQIKKELADNLNFNNNFHEFALQAGYISGESNNNYLNTQFWQRQHEAYFPEDADLFKSEFHNEINEKGDFAGINIKSNYRFNLELNRFASFGMGCWLDYDKIVFDLDYENSLEDIYTVKQGVEFDQVNDYITTETEHIYAEKQSISATSQLRLPIALEFRIADDDISSNDPFSLRNFVYRLSSTFFYNYSQLEDTYNTITSEPNMIIIEHGNGFVEEEHDTQSILTADKKITKRSSSRKQFAAGIGYRHSGNVSIDLAVIYDYPTDDYLFGLSFTIRT
jgi:hypothetical protein